VFLETARLADPPVEMAERGRQIGLRGGLRIARETRTVKRMLCGVGGRYLTPRRNCDMICHSFQPGSERPMNDTPTVQNLECKRARRKPDPQSG
jgi:hypothetical protein